MKSITILNTDNTRSLCESLNHPISLLDFDKVYYIPTSDNELLAIKFTSIVCEFNGYQENITYNYITANGKECKCKDSLFLNLKIFDSFENYKNYITTTAKKYRSCVEHCLLYDYLIQYNKCEGINLEFNISGFAYWEWDKWNSYPIKRIATISSVTITKDQVLVLLNLPTKFYNSKEDCINENICTKVINFDNTETPSKQKNKEYEVVIKVLAKSEEDAKNKIFIKS